MQFTGNFTSKLPTVGTTIFTVMSALANEHQAINLSQGFPDYEVAPGLIDLVHHHMKKGMNQYAPMQGLPVLRKAIAAKVESLYGASVDPESEITVTAGGTQAIYTAITAMIREKDEVIVFEPAYDCYIPAIELAGGIPVSIPLHGPDYAIDWNAVRKKFNSRTRMILLNSPHNPTGSLLNAADLKELARITQGTEIMIISDEVYEHLVFDGECHESVLRYPDLAHRSFAVYSFGKTYHATGWKTGYCIAPENLMREFRKVHQFMVFCVNTPIQYALADFMENRNYLELPAFFQAKRDRFLTLLQGSAFTFQPAKGSYFQLLDYSGISREKDMDFAVRLTREFGVASIPTSPFYKSPTDQKVLRFCFAKKEETLERAAERLQRVRA